MSKAREYYAEAEKWLKEARECHDSQMMAACTQMGALALELARFATEHIEIAHDCDTPPGQFRVPPSSPPPLPRMW